MVLVSMLAVLLLSTAGPPPGRERSAAAPSPPESLFVALLETGPAYVPGAPMREQPGGSGHSSYMLSLTRSGHLLLGGPYGDAPRQRVYSGAVLLVRARSLADARGMVAADPGVASGLLRVGTVSRWIPGAGTLVPSLPSLSEGR